MRETVRDMPAERVYLVGFMGAGKSTIGRALAAQLGWSFVDLDTEIEHSQKMSVRDIFSKPGEALPADRARTIEICREGPVL